MISDHDIKKYPHKWGFGMAPLKSKTEYQYKKAVYTMFLLLNGESEENRNYPDNISIFKGLINRCIKQDQWDWFTVYVKFGEPAPERLKKIPQHLKTLRKAIIQNDYNECKKEIKILKELKTKELCEIFLEKKSYIKRENDGSGYIYILSRREEPKILKIGMTLRNVADRVKEINSATGVLYPYSPRRVFMVHDARNTESLIFKTLEKYRVRKDREFFNLDYFEAEKMILKLLQEKGLLI